MSTFIQRYRALSRMNRIIVNIAVGGFAFVLLCCTFFYALGRDARPTNTQAANDEQSTPIVTVAIGTNVASAPPQANDVQVTSTQVQVPTAVPVASNTPEATRTPEPPSPTIIP